ncbi:hypothetical protein [Streptomyces sp. NPDC056308]|uniref:hypothetical protein n=1 Tax=Streptomyces sp. NPDC056308 TaxID=3345780 RepID=UPI0035D81FB5
MGRRLRVAVHLVHPETYEPVILQPGDEPDQAVAELITNPDCWDADRDQEVIEAPTTDGPDAVTVIETGTPAPEPEPEPEPAKPARRRKPAVKDEAEPA